MQLEMLPVWVVLIVLVFLALEEEKKKGGITRRLTTCVKGQYK